MGGGSRTAGGGARVAKLAAELAGSTATTAAPRASKPKDLMRSVGKIERDDWNVKEIERKIMENRLGRPEPKTAEKVPKWDREQVSCVHCMCLNTDSLYLRIMYPPSLMRFLATLDYCTSPYVRYSHLKGKLQIFHDVT